MVKGNTDTAMDMKEMLAFIEKGFGELNARQDKVDQSIKELKESIESSKVPKKGKGKGRQKTAATAMDMKEMLAFIEKGFGELNAKQDKVDQSIKELKESIESSKVPKKEKGKGREKTAATAMDMKEMLAFIEKGFGELNARQDKVDQSIKELKESIESSKVPKKGKGKGREKTAATAGSSTRQKFEDEKIDPVTKEEEEEDMSISMDAAVEYSEPYKGRCCLTGYHKKRPLKILLGLGGSTHNFINESLADKLGIDTFPIKPRTVDYALGKMVTSRVCKNFELSVQGHLFIMDLYLLPMSSNCDMVLGNQWLLSLENLMLTHMGVEFYIKGKKYFIRFDKSDDEGSNKR